MKVALPITADNGLQSLLYGHFGSAPYYAIYDTQQTTLNIIANTNQEHQYGQCRPSYNLGELGVAAVLCRGMGQRALVNLNGMGMRVFFCEATVVAEALRDFGSGKLRELDFSTACNHREHGCHGT